MSKLKITSTVWFAIGAMVLLFPVSWSICPLTQVKVIDGKGNPVFGCQLYQSWQFYGLAGERHEAKLTDEIGSGQFQARHIRVPILLYALSRGASALAVHSSFGPNVRLEISKPGFQRDHAIYAKDFRDSRLLLQGSSLVWVANLKTDEVYEASVAGEVEKLRVALNHLNEACGDSSLDDFAVNRIVLGLIGKQDFRPGVRKEIIDLLCQKLASDAGVRIALSVPDANWSKPVEKARQAGDSEMVQILETKNTR